MTQARRFLRDNIFLVAAFVLPAAVALLFIAASAIPRWTVPPPQHDLVFRVERPYEASPPEIFTDFVVRDGQLVVTVRPVVRPDGPAQGIVYPQRWALLQFDHENGEAREIPLDLPRTLPQGETQTIGIRELTARRVLPGVTAPDGYEAVSAAGGSGTGIVGDLFGMNRRYRRGLDLRRAGRTVHVELPAPYREGYGAIVPIGWLEPESSR
jgi:hypothetical protein